MNQVPTIDISAVDASALFEIDRACRDHGFFKLIGHGLDKLIDDMWKQTEIFFAAPQEFKDALMRPAESAFGYFNREMTKLKRDQKETFDYHGLPQKEGKPDNAAYWPQGTKDTLMAVGVADFETTLRTFYAANEKLAERTLRLICQALGANPNHLDDFFGSDHTSLARLNHYPPYDPLPVSEHTDDNQLGDMALHDHTDPGAITLLFQDNVGGLQTHSDRDGWIDVPPENYSFVVNLGDLTQVWSNDLYKAAAHRVLPVPTNVSRYSMPFFYSPRYDATIAPIVPGVSSHYRPFTWYEFARARVEDNYQNLGKEDTQIGNYRLSA